MYRKSCEHCGKEFFVKPYKKDTARFCSYDCYWKNKKGKRLSKKNREAMKGHIPWNKGTKGVIKAWNKGSKGILKANSGSFQKGHIPWIKGKHPNTWNKGKPIFVIRGDKHHNWKGGISTKNDKLRHNLEMYLWKRVVMERDNFTCQKYGIKGGKLNTHHINNFSEFPELRTSIENGITLSEKTHKEFHKKYGVKNNTKCQLEEFLKD